MNSPNRKLCWCGIAVGAPGHPTPHIPNKPHQTKSLDDAIDVNVDVEVRIRAARSDCPEPVASADSGGGDGEVPLPSEEEPTRGSDASDPSRPDAPVDPPSGGSRNPWDIIQTILRTEGGDTPRPRKDSFLPYLVVRGQPADRGQRPLPAGTVFWESPDIFVMPNQSAATAPSLPGSFGGMAQAGAPNTIFAHVWNLGRGPAFDVRVEFYWFNPTLGIEEADANFIGATYVSLGTRNSPKSHAVVRCPVDWIPTYLNDGHECLVVRAFSVIADPIGPNPWHAWQNRHVAQRNLAVLQGPQAQAKGLVLRLAPGHSTHAAQVESVIANPIDVPWMQLLAGAREPIVRRAAVTPLVGLLQPAVALDAGSTRVDLSGLSHEALSQLLSARYAFTRAEDPLEVTLVTRATQLAANEAHVVRVQQRHENVIVGGYTTIILP